MKTKNILALISAVLCLILFSGNEVFAAGTDSLTDAEKNSSYGFFVWLSENAETAEERADAATATQILTNRVLSGGNVAVFNDGHITASHTLGVNYEQLLSQTSIGADNDATSIDCLRDAIHFVTQGNEYRAKENLDPLMISSGLMAMAEVDVNYQGYNGKFAHSNIFAAMENLAYRMVDGTWKYGKVSGTSSDEPYEGWYTEEKKNYDTGNGGETGHYETLTDRRGVMTTTGFGVRHRFTTESLTASDGQEYDCLMDRKYYSQQFSNNSTSYFYYAGRGVTPEKYEEYLNEYSCAVIGHKWDEGTVTKEPTCTTEGTKKLTCSICGETKNETVEALGHELKMTAAVEPSCKKEGNSTYYTCSRCKKYFSDPDGKAEIAKNSWILSKTEHEYGEWSVKEPATCTDDGVKEKVCAECGDKIKETIPATGHNLNIIAANPATTTAEGNIEYWKCSNCGKFFEDADGTKEIKEKDTIISKLKEEKTDPADIESDKAKAKENLSKVINEAKEKYTEESYRILEDAISVAEVVLAKENAKVEELEKAAESVETAINNLKEKKAKEESEKKAAAEAREALNNNIAEAKKIEQGNYTDESYKALQDAIGEAEKLAADPNATSEQLKAANTRIEEAKKALAEKPDPAKQYGKDGTAAGPGASREAAEAAIAGMTDDSDLPGAVFNKLQLKSKKQTNTSITISWNKVSGAKKYVIYGNKCGKKTKLKKLATVKAKDTKTYTRTFKKVLGKKLKKGTYYKFMIVALDSNNKVVSSSKIIHVATKGGKVGNVSKVTTKAKKNKVTVKKGKTFKLAGKQIAASKKLKVKEHRKVTYESTNPKVAKVSKKGVITGKKRGSCYVYAYAQNGVFAKIKVTIK